MRLRSGSVCYSVRCVQRALLHDIEGLGAFGRIGADLDGAWKPVLAVLAEAGLVDRPRRAVYLGDARHLPSPRQVGHETPSRASSAHSTAQTAHFGCGPMDRAH
jgi:hypothetical protein